MQTVVAIILLTIALTLFWAWRNHRISNDTLNALAGIFTVVAGIAAIILFLVPAATPPNSTSTNNSDSNIDALLPSITQGQGGIQKAIPWWGEYTRGGDNGEYDPSASPGWEGCFGVAWNVLGFNEKVIVFQSKRELEFQPGGWYTQICVPDNIEISPEDVGRIQSAWLSKEYGVNWEVQVLP